MFNEEDIYDEVIKEMLSLFSLEDLLDQMDITQEQVLYILLSGGHVSPPPFLEKGDDDGLVDSDNGQDWI